MIKLTVDGMEIQVREENNLLVACLENDIYIPNLCYLEGMEDPPASCRLCFVEVAGERAPVAACRVKPQEGMVVRTDTPEVRRLQRSALRLLLSVHKVDCAHCPSNKKCALQDMAKFLKVGLKPKRLEYLEREIGLGEEHPLFEFNHQRCVLCGRCVYVCKKNNRYSLLTFAKRGFDTVITCFGQKEIEKLPCSNCNACVEVCPVSAIFLKDKSA